MLRHRNNLLNLGLYVYFYGEFTVFISTVNTHVIATGTKENILGTRVFRVHSIQHTSVHDHIKSLLLQGVSSLRELATFMPS